MRTRRLVAVAALVAFGCSDGPSTTSDPGPSAEERSSVATASTTTTTTLRPPVPTDPPLPPAPTIGELEIPCGPTDPLVIARPGVSDQSITIGTGSDRGGIATPDAGIGTIEMIEALADHCTALGGLHGRDLQVVEYDAAAAETVDRVRQACEEVVALVGHSFLQVVEEVLTALDCGLARYPAGDDLTEIPPIRLHGQLAAAFADPAAAQIVLVGPDTPTARVARDTHRAALDVAGGPLVVVGSVAYPIDRVPDWDRLVGEARSTGAGQVVLTGGCAQAVLPFVDVAARAGWAPMIVATPAAYEAACLDVATPDRLLVELPFLPFEDGADAPTVSAHADLLDLTAAPRTGNGLLAATAFWRWAVDFAACPGGVGDDCASPITEDWTAGGLHPPLGPDGSGTGCAVVMGIVDGAFVRRLPVDPGTYDCTEAFTLPAPPAA